MPHTDGTGEVAIRGLSAGYAGTEVLHGITARIPLGRLTTIVGANGSGKSTLLAAIAGVLPPVSGAVHLPATTRPALVVQRSAVPDRLPITVRETVEMGRWARRGSWRRLSESDHSVVADTMRALGVATLARRRLSTLSGGQRQRVLVAQGLAQEPDVLLLDEPTAGLDTAAREAIAAVLAETAARGTAVVHVTHDQAEAANADHCLVLSGGHLVGEGPPCTVLAAHALDTARPRGTITDESHPVADGVVTDHGGASSGRV